MRPTERQLEARMSRLKMQAGSATGRDLTPGEMEERERCEASFYEFCKRAWREVDPAPFMDVWHVKALADALQDAHEGNRNLLALLPPGLGKSLIASVLYPCWTWAKDPTVRFLASSHSQTISVRDTRRARDVLRSAWFQKLWPHVRLLADQDQKTRYQNEAGGWRIATSTGSGVTGERAGVILLDDPVDLRSAFYPDEITRAVDHFRTALRSRGSGDATRYVAIMQRLVYEDFAASLLDEAERGGLEWDVLRLPMRFDPSDPDPRDERRLGGMAEGQTLLFPEMFGEREVQKLEISYGAHAAAILQQKPNREHGAIFRREWVRDFYIEDQGGRLEYLLDDPNGARGYSQAECGVFCTVDLASSLSEGADRTCYAAWAATPDGDLLLLDLRWGRIPGERQLPELRDFCKRWRPWKVLIEAVGYQQAFVSQAAAAGLPGVEPIHRGPRQHKELRASALAVLMSEGRFYVPALIGGAIPTWREDYLSELLAFPTGRHDDVVDVSADAAREVASGGYHLLRNLYDAGPDYSRLAGPFGLADPGMVRFDPPFGIPVRFDPPFGGF